MTIANQVHPKMFMQEGCYELICGFHLDLDSQLIIIDTAAGNVDST